MYIRLCTYFFKYSFQLMIMMLNLMFSIESIHGLDVSPCGVRMLRWPTTHTYTLMMFIHPHTTAPTRRTRPLIFCLII